MTSLPVPTLPSLPSFPAIAVIALVAAVTLAVGAALLLRRRGHTTRRPRPVPLRRGRHSEGPDDAWHTELADIRDDFHAGRSSETQAYAALSALARDFASQRLGTDLSSSTLLDLNRRHQVSSKEQFTRLRQTIAALYPAEFAPSTNVQASQTSVDQAADWVDDLLERWDR